MSYKHVTTRMFEAVLKITEVFCSLRGTSCSPMEGGSIGELQFAGCGRYVCRDKCDSTSKRSRAGEPWASFLPPSSSIRRHPRHRSPQCGRMGVKRSRTVRDRRRENNRECLVRAGYASGVLGYAPRPVMLSDVRLRVRRCSTCLEWRGMYESGPRGTARRCVDPKRVYRGV